MPQTGSNGGGGKIWDNENNVFTTDQSWLPSTATSVSGYVFDSNVNAQTQTTGISVVDHSGAARNASLEDSHQFNFDFHRTQTWPVVLDSEQAQASAGARPVTAGGDWRSFFASTDPALGNINTGGDTVKRPASERTARRNQTTASLQTSPTDSLTSRSSLSSTKAVAPRSAPSEYTANQSASKPPKASSMNSKTAQASTAGQIVANSKTIPGASKFSAVKKMYSGTNTLDVDEDTRRSQAGQYARGGSSVSSTSGFSLSKSEAADDENLRPSQQENSGAGKTPGVLRLGYGSNAQNGQFTLPPGKGFPIQIGSELFRLSGASIMSDGQYRFGRLWEMIYAKSPRAPSYFSRFFEEQLRQNEDGSGGVRTLYIDRDPATFHDICRHLQGSRAQICIKIRGG